uniref:TRAF-type domain-containing protein n=1 Tax=Chromera velia CCMP2878 TaxID=1169474 RepID=A0A0G4HAT3_9ALVE|eukprot:Cvel_6134.t1-p1 / transcript=Cvel_6134.t1 / gene=Cvel_6134 / organism=Chromera_velia_CCMP2878 / gene_product=TNF receptor-associated factor 5, putative / transcript_product=TNF receptor-associated factor 5, putative / location=Cvel_scaffold296:56799-58310(-) / protein_length=407 / sequence_SO=supercontig / SO=protein_coding / is_pseudo=false
MMEKIQWKCLNFETGCGFVGVKKHLEEHIDLHCPLQETGCPFKGCTERVIRRDMSTHTDVCLFRPIPCSFCAENVALYQMTTHLKGCAEVPLDCPKNCGKKPLRKQLAYHLEHECEEAEVDCCVPGCCLKMKRKFLDKHGEENWKVHINLFVQHEKNLKEHIRVLELRVAEKEARRIPEVRHAAGPGLDLTNSWSRGIRETSSGSSNGRGNTDGSSSSYTRNNTRGPAAAQWRWANRRDDRGSSNTGVVDRRRWADMVDSDSSGDTSDYEWGNGGVNSGGNTHGNGRGNMDENGWGIWGNRGGDGWGDAEGDGRGNRGGDGWGGAEGDSWGNSDGGGWGGAGGDGWGNRGGDGWGGADGDGWGNRDGGGWGGAGGDGWGNRGGTVMVGGSAEGDGWETGVVLVGGVL